ncbi:MAG: hypothetical protein DI581_11805 [Staphylococcus capitis]|nr:MAG: hypothetical protein DI581_11805 [Staphylococcus capitis]
MGVVNIGVFKWIFGINEEQFISDWVEASNIVVDNHLKESAIQTVVGKIYNTVELIQFETEDENLNYKLNVKPNSNQNSNEFKRTIIEKLIFDGECLVIIENKNFYIADSFTVDDSVIHNKKYSNIVIGDMIWNKTYYSDEVFHFKYHNEKIKLFINNLNKSYGALFDRVVSIQMRERQLRVYAKFKSMMSQDNRNKFKSYLSDLRNQLESQSVVVAPRQDDYDLEEKSQSYVGRPINEVNEVEKMYIYSLANALQVPPLLFSGDLADVSQHNRNFLNHCIKPLMNIITSEINAKYFGVTDFKRTRKRLRINTIDAYYVNEFDMAADVEKMIGTGAWTIDDILDLRGEDRLNTKISTQRYLTKNIAPLDEDGFVREERK